MSVVFIDVDWFSKAYRVVSMMLMSRKKMEYLLLLLKNLFFKDELYVEHSQ